MNVFLLVCSCLDNAPRSKVLNNMVPLLWLEDIMKRYSISEYLECYQRLTKTTEHLSPVDTDLFTALYSTVP